MKLLNINEDRLMRSDYFAILISLLTAALIMLPLLLSAKSKDADEVKKLKIEDSLSFRYLNCTRAAIVYTSHEAGNYTLSIETKNGDEVLYSEYVRAMGKTARVFDFLNLEDGAYKVVAKKNGKSIYAYNEKELKELQKQYKGYEQTHYKGLGELTTEDMRLTMCNEENQRLERLTLHDAQKAYEQLEMLMGKFVNDRREFLFENVNFGEEYDY